MKTVFIGDNPRLEAIREGNGARCVVIAHPHPLYGGDMHNNVVMTASDAALAKGFSSLRFNFRGVGRSEGIHDEGRGEVQDMEAALTAAGVAPIIIAYSYGAWVAAAVVIKRSLPAIFIAPPVEMLPFPDLKDAEVWVVVGSADQFCSQKALQEKIAAERLSVIKGIDHFWIGRESLLRSYLDGVLKDFKVSL